MEPKRIYTAGRMKGISLEEQMEWRIRLKDELEINWEKKFVYIMPPTFYNYAQKVHKTEREVKEWELSQLAKCDVMVVNLDDIEKSIGTITELATAVAVNNLTDRHIYIIGIGENKDLHPWISDSIFRFEPDVESAAEYISDYLLI